MTTEPPIEEPRDEAWRRWVMLGAWLLVMGVWLVVASLHPQYHCLKIAFWTAIIVICAAQFPPLKSLALRYPWRTMLLSLAALAIYVALFVICCLPPEFVHLRDGKMSSTWIYQDAEAAARAGMTKFVVTSGSPSFIGDAAIRYLRFFPLLPACLFLIIALSCHTQGALTEFGAKAIKWLALQARILGGKPGAAGKLVATALAARASVAAHQRRQTFVKATLFLSAAAIAANAVWTFRTPRSAAVAATIVMLLLAILNYLLLFRNVHWHASYHRRPVPIVIRIAAPLVSVALYGAAVLFVADSRAMIRTLNGSFPRPFPAESVVAWNREATATFRDVVVLFSGSDPINNPINNPEVVRTIHDKTQAVLETISHQLPPHLTSINLCRGAWFIFWVVCALAICIFEAVDKLPSLLFVVVAYIAIGLSFGVIYYDYYLQDVTASNFLLNALSDVKHLQKLRDSWPHLSSSEKTQQQSFEPAKIAAAVVDDKFTTLIRSGFFSSAVFAQDLPHLSVETTAPERSRRLFACSFQFSKSGFSMSPILHLAHVPDPNRLPKVEEVLDTQDDSAKRGTASPPDPQKALRACENTGLEALAPNSRSWTSGDQATNAGSARQLVHFLCIEKGRKRGAGNRGYVVEIIAGADCGGNEPSNRFLVDHRQHHIREKILQIMSALVTDTESSRLTDIRNAVQRPMLMSYVQPRLGGVR
jgi:hypothetical protein